MTWRFLVRSNRSGLLGSLATAVLVAAAGGAGAATTTTSLLVAPGLYTDIIRVTVTY